MKTIRLREDSDVYMRVRLEAVPYEGEKAPDAVAQVAGDGARALVERALHIALSEFLGAAQPAVALLSCTVDAARTAAGGWGAVALVQVPLGTATLVRSALALARVAERGCPLVFVVEAVAPALVSVAVRPHAFEDAVLHELEDA